MTIDNLTIGEAKELAKMFGNQTQTTSLPNPFIGKRVLVRTYSAGVHIGTLVEAIKAYQTYVDASDFQLKEWSKTRDDLLFEARKLEQQALKQFESEE